METCKNCIYWAMDDHNPKDKTKGLCLELKTKSDPNIKAADFINVDNDAIVMPIYSTGCDFGCVHFKEGVK